MATLQELIAQQQELARQIEAARKAEVSDAVAQIRKLMAEYNLSVDEITEKASSKKGAKVAAKYRNPETGDTWTGRGRQPKWVEAALAAGKTLDDLAI